MNMKRTREKRQARMADESSSMADLPSHILMEIISRLSIKTVVAIRCVCKSLLSLVSDSHFQMLHSTRAPTELLVTHTLKSSTTLCIPEYVFVDDSVTAVDAKSNVVFELPNFSVGCHNNCNFGATETTLTFVNSCYGLVCFRGPPGNMFAVICNPFTREYITFSCPARKDNAIETHCVCYGLGFSPKDNCFKLVRLIYKNYAYTDSGEETSRVVGEMYTFGERGSWKMVANRPHACLSRLGRKEVIFHEGSLHWYCTSDDAIVTFDCDTELFGKLVTLPRMGDLSCSKLRWSLAMGVFENCLYTTACVGDYVDIWSLKEYGQDSWVKIFSIQKDVKSFSESYKPFKYLQNGQVLMFKNHGGIVCFNPDTGSIKDVSGIYGDYGAVLIRPSLVSLKVGLGDKVKVRSVKLKPWDRKKAATVPRMWTRTEDVLPPIMASQQGGADVGRLGSQDPRLPNHRLVDQSSSGTQKLASEIETLKAENERMGKAIETLNAENDRKGKAIELLNAENDRQGKAIDTLTADNERQGKAIETLNAENVRQGKGLSKLKQGKKEDRAFMRFIYQQMLNVNSNMPPCPMPCDSNDDSD